MHFDRFSGGQQYLSLIEVMLGRLANDNVVERLWAGDASLWHPSAETQAKIKQRLGWLKLPSLVDSRVGEWLETVRNEGYTSVVLVATGDAAATARLWRDTQHHTSDVLNIVLFDTIDPIAAVAILDTLDVNHTAVIFLGVELSVEMRVLSTLVFDRLGCRNWEQIRSLLVTTPGSSFEQWLMQHMSVQPLYLPLTVSERFGALSALGWTPAFLYGHNVDKIVQSAKRMRDTCKDADNLATNPGVWLGVVLGVLAQQGRDILTLIASPPLVPLAKWIASFVAGSLSKHRRGFVPVVDEPRAPTEHYRNNRIFVHLTHVNNVDPVVADHVAALEADGHPVVQLTVADYPDIAAEIARWQVAVAVAATIIGVNPFDEPDTDAMQRFIQRHITGEGAAATKAPINIWDSALDTVLRQLFEHNWRAGYVVLVCYFEPSETVEILLTTVRTRLQQRLQLASTVVYPLRDAVASAQLLHAGRDNGIVVALSRDNQHVMPLPEHREELTQLVNARRNADLIGWQQLGRAYCMIYLEADVETGLRRLQVIVDQI